MNTIQHQSIHLRFQAMLLGVVSCNILLSQTWWSESTASMLIWHRGGRWIPAIHNGQWWRWISSLVLHENHNHIISNMSLFLVLSYFMEQKYGTVRVTLIAIISGLGGNLFRCVLVPYICLLIDNSHVGHSDQHSWFVSVCMLKCVFVCLHWQSLGAWY